MVRNESVVLVGKFYKAIRGATQPDNAKRLMLGEILAEVASGVYLFQSILADGTIPSEQRLIYLDQMYPSGENDYDFILYNSLQELLGVEFQAKGAAPEPTKVQSEKLSIEAAALRKLYEYIGKGGVLGVDAVVQEGQPTSFEVVVNEALKDAGSEVPSNVGGFSVKVVTAILGSNGAKEPKRSKKWIEPAELIESAPPEKAAAPAPVLVKGPEPKKEKVVFDFPKALDEMGKMVGEYGVVSVRAGSSLNVIVEVNGDMSEIKECTDKGDDGVYRLHGAPIEFVAYKSPEALKAALKPASEVKKAEPPKVEADKKIEPPKAEEPKKSEVKAETPKVEAKVAPPKAEAPKPPPPPPPKVSEPIVDEYPF
jgi:microcompartment protein CcmL/EutN